MGLKKINFKLSYRSSSDDLIKDFYLPALSNSKTYYRAAGFFSNSTLNNLGKSIYPFILKDGKMKLICGVHLSKEDIEEIKNGLYLKNKIENKLLSEVSLFGNFLSSEISNICWMIANDKLDIKIAINLADNNVQSGIYHEKIGIFIDEENNILATNGSSNETDSAYRYNFEYFDVFRSWGSDNERERVREKINYFNDLWRNETNKLLILDFPKAVKDKIIPLAPTNPIKPVSQVSEERRKLNKENLKPRNYQLNAIKNWFDNNCAGILEMATGTGKTYTSLFAVERYINLRPENNVLIVCCPYQHLVDQWEKSIKDVFGKNINIIKCYKSVNIWYGQLMKLMHNILFGNIKFGVIITTTSTGSSDNFTNAMSTEKINKIIICDEVHNIGANHNKNFLKIDSQARLGLSATPIRPYDEEGNKAINEYFGKSVFSLDIEEAIKRGFLVKYNYHIIFSNLNSEEYQRYKKLSVKIAKCFNKEDVTNEERLQNLLIKRARIIATCSEKLIYLRKIIRNLDNHNHLLVYTAENPEFFNETLTTLQNECLKTLKITSEIKNDQRNEIIEKLQKEDIDCILAMRCLDEGVDIPSADKAILLSSSTNSKQYIQRRGRVLRKDKNGKKIATIFDFLVLPPEFNSKTDENLFKRELKRIFEFAASANNKSSIIRELISFVRNNALIKNFTEFLEEVEL